MPMERQMPPRPAPPDWVLVADAARARVLERDAETGALRELSAHVHPASRLKGRALASARPGQVRKGGASTAFAPRTSPAERERSRFAHELAELLESAALAQRLGGLVLLASNPFLGELNAHLGPAARGRVKAGAALDLTHYRGAELEQRVTRVIEGPAEPAAPEELAPGA